MNLRMRKYICWVELKCGGKYILIENYIMRESLTKVCLAQ